MKPLACLVLPMCYAQLENRIKTALSVTSAGNNFDNIYDDSLSDGFFWDIPTYAEIELDQCAGTSTVALINNDNDYFSPDISLWLSPNPFDSTDFSDTAQRCYQGVGHGVMTCEGLNNHLIIRAEFDPGQRHFSEMFIWKEKALSINPTAVTFSGMSQKTDSADYATSLSLFSTSEPYTEKFIRFNLTPNMEHKMTIELETEEAITYVFLAGGTFYGDLPFWIGSYYGNLSYDLAQVDVNVIDSATMTATPCTSIS